MKTILSTLVNDEVWLVSAYMKVGALKTLTEGLDVTNSLSILCRWEANDLLSGASDLDVFSYARARGWSFLVRQDLHAKAYRLGSKAIFIGSGNLTNKGFILTDEGNLETMVNVEASLENINSLERIFDHAIRIDEDTFLAIKDWVGRHPGLVDADSKELEDYPLNRLSLIEMVSPPTCLMVSECFHTNGSWILESPELQDESQLHDLSLLGFALDIGACRLTSEKLMHSVTRTKIFAWLYAKVSESPNKELYFGELTAALHSALIDDPKPYRKDVKSLLANLIGWIELITRCGLCIDRPNFSQRVSLCE